ncbi:MAG TPA: glycoside hydrolase family 18 protein [Terriglobales bacterium]|nr:glycoside hydrolase family 18 protein [Terriglobales bacterium]
MRTSSRPVHRTLCVAAPVVFLALLAGLALTGCGKSDTGGEPPAGLTKVVIGYYPSWNRASFDHAKVDYKHLTHIANAFAWPDAAGNLIVPSDYLYPELNAAAHANGVKMILSLGGWGNGDGFPGMAATASNRARFIGQVVSFCEANAYDGVDIDWEFVSDATEEADFVLFIQELSAALKARSPQLLLTMAAPADAYYGQWIDYETLAAAFDFIGFMTYDYHGSWSDRSGHNSPLYADAGDTDGSVDETFQYARQRQVPLGKLLLGVPFYGKSFDCGGLGLPFMTSEDYSYTQAMQLLASGWTRTWDATAQVPWLRRPDGGTILCYDDTESVAAKCDYVTDRQAAGIIIWDISEDYRNGASELLAAVGRSFASK